MLKNIQFANGLFVVDTLRLGVTVSTKKDLYDGDTKSKLPALPPDYYKVFAILNNCYGIWIVVTYKGKSYSISPLDCIYIEEE